MSQRYYSGPAPRRGASTLGALVTWALAAAVVGLQVAYPLTADDSLARLATATVVVFFLASAAHAWVYRGVAWTLAMVAVTAVGGLVAELVGTQTGLLFGDYTYSDALGPALVGTVPVAVPLAWTMMAYPAYVVGTTLARPAWLVGLVGGWVLMAWDLFLDPMMVDLGAWTWQSTDPEVPGVPGIPATNFAGWFVVGTLMVGALALLPRLRAPRGQPAALFLWVYASSVLAAAVFFDRPSVALVGGVAMGLVAVPFAWRLWDSRG
jgi:putative membrane protein